MLDEFLAMFPQLQEAMLAEAKGGAGGALHDEYGLRRHGHKSLRFLHNRPKRVFRGNFFQV